MARTWDEMQVNLEHNDVFRAFCEAEGVIRRNFYGGEEVYVGTYRGKPCQEFVRKFRSTTGCKLWYKDSFEWGLAVDAMPFGGWQDEKDAVEFLKALRKINTMRNSEVRAFMRDWTHNPEWDF